MTIICLRAQDWTQPVLPPGTEHDKCGRCGAVVLMIAGARQASLMMAEPPSVRCLGCAAIEGNLNAQHLFRAMFGRDPQSSPPTTKGAAA